jgi:hypothetical protein
MLRIASVCGGLSGGRCERPDAPFEERDPLLEDVGGWVHDPGVDVAHLGEREEVRRVLGALKT